MNSSSATGVSAGPNAQDQPFFRPEAVAARQALWLGVIRVGRPLSFSFATCSAVGVAAALIAFACLTEVTRKASVHGLLVPQGGVINVSAHHAGVIARVLVQEGDEVTIGQPLVQLTTLRVTTAGDVASLTAQAMAARRSALESERRLAEQSFRQRLENLRQRQQSLQAEERQAIAELETHQLRLTLAHKTLSRQKQLEQEGFVAPAQVQQKQEELLDLQLRERNSRRNLQALQRDLQGVSADSKALELQTQTTLAQLHRVGASLDQEQTEAEERNGLTLTAPQSGRVSAIIFGQGQYIQAGQTLVSMLPSSVSKESARSASELQAHLFAPSRTAGFVQPGQTVWLRYAAFPYQKFGMGEGQVIAVSGSPIVPQDLPGGQAQALVTATQSNEPTYRITVRLMRQNVDAYGKPRPLVAGMSLDAEVTLDSRTIWEWIFEPAIAVAGRKRDLSSATKSSPG